MNTSEVYMFTFPNGKVYIGECNQRTRDDKKWGTKSRLGIHLGAARNDSRNTRLCDAIREFGEDNFTVEVLMVVDTSEVDFYEEQLIEILDATNPEVGYNTHPGGKRKHRHTEETCQRMSERRRAYTPKPPSEKTKKKISRTNLNIKRYGHRNQLLPMYLGLRNSSDRCGYRISEFHPLVKHSTQKSFVSTIKGDDKLDENYSLCIQELYRLNRISMYIQTSGLVE
jgi:group I intron endonuclease